MYNRQHKNSTIRVLSMSLIMICITHQSCLKQAIIYTTKEPNTLSRKHKIQRLAQISVIKKLSKLTMAEMWDCILRSFIPILCQLKPEALSVSCCDLKQLLQKPICMARILQYAGRAPITQSNRL